MSEMHFTAACAATSKAILTNIIVAGNEYACQGSLFPQEKKTLPAIFS